jgi:diguanylate cyclase (GGDEF)-like protein/PAS domain S-box-containing protein
MTGTPFEEIPEPDAQALRASEAKYREILETIEDAYYEVDLQGNLVLVNGAFCRLVGYTSDELIGRSNRDFQSPDMAANVFRIFHQVFRSGEPASGFDWGMIHREGHTVVGEGSVQLVRDAAGRPAGFRGILRDVTERRRMEQQLRDSEERYRTILETIEDAYYEVDIKGNHTMLNGAFCRMIGYTREELLYKSYREVQSPEAAAHVFAAFHEVYLTGEPNHSLDWEMFHKDGSIVIGEGSVQLVRDAYGQPTGFRGIIRNVTQRRTVEQQLRESEARFRALTHLSSDWYWEQDEEFRYTRMEGRHEKADAVREFYLGRRPWEAGLEINMSGGWDAHREQIAAHGSFRDVVMQGVTARGRPYYINVSAEPMFDADGRFTGYRGVSREITEQKMAEARIQHLATHDALTGLPNRVMFNHMLSNAIPTAQRHQQGIAVLFIDLDRFKFINDTLGHEAGDVLLTTVTARFKQALRASDMIARLGGDEFVVLVQDLHEPEQAAVVARKLLSAAIKPVMLLGRECRVTASIGIAVYPQDGEDEQTLMKNADIAMYHAKEEGKNNFQFYSKHIKSLSMERLTLENNLRHALDRDELTLHYQAKRDLGSGAITGTEALLRWNNRELGMVSPAQFIPVAEETGLIIPIGKWVMQTACQQNMAWQRQGLPPVCMAVNLSARQFADPDLLADVEAILRDTGMPPHLLELEITESMVVHNPAQALNLLTRIKQMGVRLAIDDFGTGYSSLGQLKNFPIDTLKVDRSFIRDISTNAEDKAITEAIIAMGKTLSLTVVAEGVETQEQEAFLRAHACDEMQGYYFSKPLAADDFAALLGAHTA